jgi:FtsH-binding integral membrane protein
VSPTTVGNRFQDALPAKNAQRDGDAMSMLDLFAWLVLLILAASTIAVVIIMAMLPGMIAKERKHPWAQAVTVAGWVTLLFGFVLWPVALVWAYVDVPQPKAGEITR